MRSIFTMLSAAVVIAGCASTGVVPTDRGIFMISKESAAGVFGTSGGVRADIYAEANEFCARSSKVVETVNLDVKDAVPFVRTSRTTSELNAYLRNNLVVRVQISGAGSDINT